jgi:antitoxin PrlF
MVLAHSKLTSQGQISVPAQVRRKLGIGPGSVLEWDEEDGRVVVRKAGQYSFEDTRRALGFEHPPKPRSLKSLRNGIRQYMRNKYARD